jgi:hypothetical protein
VTGLGLIVGKHIDTGDGHVVSNQLKNQAINKTEGFVNNKANTFLNAFGAGRSEVSIGGLSSKNGIY